MIQPKKNGKARKTADLSALSRAGQHESHNTGFAADIVKSVPASMLKSALDCDEGYHSIDLDPRHRHKTTFATEWCLFRFKRVPQGYLSPRDNYTKHTDGIMEACPNKPQTTDRDSIIDDMIVFSKDMEEQFFRVCSLLSHCDENSV